MKPMARCLTAGYLGTSALVFFGAGSILLASLQFGTGNLLTVALAHGLVLAVFVTVALYISGGPFNPAVSVGLVVAGDSTGSSLRRHQKNLKAPVSAS